MDLKISRTQIQGIGHRQYDIPCQDQTDFVREPDFACICLADGAGSKRFSDIGAQIAVQSVCEFVNAHREVCFDVGFDGNALLAYVREKLHQSEYLFHELASTLLFAAYYNKRILIGHLGDGMIWMHDGSSVSVLSMPENGAQKNITFFTTGDDALQHLRVRQFAAKTPFSVMLMSDGAADMLYDGQNRVAAPALDMFFEGVMYGDEDRISDILHQKLEQAMREHTPDDVSFITLSLEADV